MTAVPTETRPRIGRRNLPMLLLMARETIITHFRPILNHYGLTEQQWRIIRVLIDEGEMEQRHIAASCQILGPSLAGILARMEEGGLITRQKAPSDQRRILVSTTAAAEALARELAPLIDAQYRLLEEALGEAVIDALFRSLDGLLALRDQPVRHVPLPER